MNLSYIALQIRILIVKKSHFLVIFLLTSIYCSAQYKFSGNVDNSKWNENVYLSIIDDYRHLSGVYSEQVIAKTQTDSLGHFEFSGNELEETNRIYRIHVDNCDASVQEINHFNGHCDDSKEILFIAKNTDTIQFPFSFDNEMFCDVTSNNSKANAFVKIDSLKEVMRFAYSEVQSKASLELNNKKWFKKLQNFGKQLDEPLAELYIYCYLSDRNNSLHEHYLEDLKSNSYYDDLLNRLTEKYPNALYTKQYKNELNSDKYIVSDSIEESTFKWNYIIFLLLFLSIILNIILWNRIKKVQESAIKNATQQLTKQEQTVLDLLLENKSNKEIANTLFVSVSTVKTHVNNVYKKLNVQSRKEAKELFNR